jgi:outer membrane immunogenic protein
MRSLLAALAAVALLLGTAASAADKLSPPARSMMDPPAEGSVHNGAYAGLTVGYSAAVFDAQGADLGSDKPLAGLYGGWGRVASGVYYGVEADVMLTDISAKIGADDFSVSGKNDYLASLRLRIGFPIGLAMPYLTAGAAYTNAKLKVSDGIDTVSASDGLWGLAAGGGLDLALTENSVMRVEGLYYAFPDQSLTFDGDKIRMEQTMTVVRAGFAFRF